MDTLLLWRAVFCLVRAGPVCCDCNAWTRGTWQLSLWLFSPCLFLTHTHTKQRRHKRATSSFRVTPGVNLKVSSHLLSFISCLPSIFPPWMQLCQPLSVSACLPAAPRWRTLLSQLRWLSRHQVEISIFFYFSLQNKLTRQATCCDILPCICKLQTHKTFRWISVYRETGNF